MVVMADDVLYREHDIGEPAAVVESVGELVLPQRT